MDWFEKLTGFRELSYEDTRNKLAIDGSQLRSLVNGKSYDIGELKMPSLGDLRAMSVGAPRGRLRVKLVSGDVRRMHRLPENSGAVFQVASQFNLLEMVSPEVTPEHGVTRYQHDHTQGPACAIAAGAATIYRNYFAPVEDGVGQTRHRQLNALADLGTALSNGLGRPVEDLWSMRNGYAMCSQNGLERIAEHLRAMQPTQLDLLRGALRIGLHRDVEVTEVAENPRPRVSQAFCSALPIAYTDVPRWLWEPFATLILEAAYEATVMASMLNAGRGVSNVVLLTQLGGGAFGNHERWIEAAIRRALDIARPFDLEVRLVSHGHPSEGFSRIASEFG